jgi:Holliday junction resolvase RusA-like endonuclease
MATIEFTVYGKPEPRGSKQAFVPLHPKTKQPYRRDNGGVVVSTVDDNKKSKGWMQSVASEARDAYAGEPLGGPLRLSLTFHMPRPEYHFGTGRNAGVIKPRFANAAHTKKPDRLKLARAVEDALSGVLYVDDAQTVAGPVEKQYCDPGTEPRVEITIEELEDA